MMQTEAATSARLVKGIGAKTYGQIVNIFTQIIGVPILLRFWGTEMYGEWIILTSIPAYLANLDLGFSISAANDMTASMARKDQRGMLVIFQSLSVLVYGIVLIGIVVCAFLSFSLPFDKWMHITIISVSETRWILWLLACGFLIQLADGVNQAGFRANGEYAFHSFCNYTGQIISQFAMWTMVISNAGPVWAAFSWVLVRIIYNIIMTIVLFKRHRTLETGFKYCDFHHLSTLIKPACANLAIPIAQSLNIQGMVLVIGATLSPLAVVVFSTIRTLTRSALQLVLSVSHAFEPEMAAAWGKNDKNLLRKLYISNLRLGFWLALIAVLFLLIFGNWIINIWTNGKVQNDMFLYSVLLISALASVLWYCGLVLIKSTNRHLRSASWFVFASLAAVILGLFLLNMFHLIIFAGISLLLMDGLMMAFVFSEAAHIINISSKQALMAMVDFPSIFHEISGLISKYKEKTI